MILAQMALGRSGSRFGKYRLEVCSLARAGRHPYAGTIEHMNTMHLVYIA